MSIQPKEVASAALAAAKKSGASESEAFIVTNRELTVGIRDGRAESVKQSDARGLGLRVIVDGKSSLVYTSDFRPEAVATLAGRAVALARSSEPDPANVLADPAKGPAGLELHDPAVAALTPDRMIAMAVEAEKAARAVDKVTSTQFGGGQAATGETWVVNSRGAEAHYPRSVVGVFVVVLADDTEGKKRQGNDGSVKRFLADLRAPGEIGREAGMRAARMVGAKKVATQRLPVLMHRNVASTWVQNMFSAFSGEQVFKKASYLGDKLGQPVASPLITIVDDGPRSRAVGGAPFDDEGVPTQRVVLLEKGVVKGFAYNLRWAKKAGVSSTGHATRGYTSVPGIGPHNVYIENGTMPVEEMIRGIDHGLYLTNTGAFGYDPATGGYSYQASGLMIEKGELSQPVTDISIASDTLAMLKGVTKVGNDLQSDGPINAPHLLIDEMALSGT